MTRIKTVRERTSVPSQLAGIVAVVVPPLGLVAAIWLLWDRGVRPVDLVLLAGLLRRLRPGDHRRLPPALHAQELRDERSAPWHVGDSRVHGDAGAGHPVGDRPPQAPRAFRPAWRPALTACRARRLARRAHARALALAHRLALLDQGPRARGRIRARPVRDMLVRGIDRLYLLWVMLTLGLPFLTGYVVGGTWQRGVEAMVWARLVRIFLFQHVTFSINSICHFFGEQPFRTRDESRNVWLLAIPSFGESWHNGHHAFPASAVHGLEPGQLDISALVIRGMENSTSQPR